MVAFALASISMCALRVSSDPPLYEQISRIVAARPDEPIGYDSLPPIPAGEMFYYPGVRDVSGRTGEKGDRSWETVIAAILAAHKNKLTDWRVLEHNVKAIPFIEQIDNVLKHFTQGKITFNTSLVFSDLMRSSSDYNAAKWGIIITAAAELRAADIDALLLLARHSEFTLPVCHAFSRQTGWHRHHYPRLVELLPVTEGWGLFQVVRFILREPALASNQQIRRDMVLACLKHGSVARIPIAFEIASSPDFLALIAGHAKDQSFAHALLELLDVLTTGGESAEILLELEDGEEIVQAYLKLIESLPHSIETLAALRVIFFALNHETIPWEERERLQNRTHSMLLERLARETLIEAIRNGNHRETALLLVKEGEMSELAPIVREELRRELTPLAIEVLGSIGTEKHLRELFALLPDRREIEERAALTHDTPLTVELYQRTLLYAGIVRHIGKLGTAEAIRRIEEAACDFRAEVRVAAMMAMQTLLPWTLNARSKALVRRCLEDDVEFVREAAKATAAYHMLHASLERTGKGTLAAEAGVSLN